MRDLLRPARIPPRQALDRCHSFLGTRWKRWFLARRLLPADLRDDVACLGTWHVLLREETLKEDPDLGELTRTLEDVFEKQGTNSLGIALIPCVRKHRIPALLLRGPLEEHRRERHVHTFETRDDLLQHARRVAQPEGRILLSVFDRQSERNEILVDALSVGLQLTYWLVHLSHDLRAGRLFLAIEDLVRHGVDLNELRDGRLSPATRELIADQIAWARSLLEKGWPLCDELGPLQGRELAFLLRWHAASLSAVEARRYDASSGPPPAGWLRLLACGVVSLATVEAPRFS